MYVFEYVLSVRGFAAILFAVYMFASENILECEPSGPTSVELSLIAWLGRLDGCNDNTKHVIFFSVELERGLYRSQRFPTTHWNAYGMELYPSGLH